MRKSILTVSIALIILIAIGATYLLYPLTSRIRPKTLSNVTELYSFFTPYMETQINSRLQAIGCQPKEYYYNDSSVCFVCKKFDVCLSYAWVNVTGGERISPTEAPYLTNFETFDSEVANFYKDGLATKLNCKPKNESALSCDLLVSFILLEKDVKMFLLDKANFERVSEIICNNFNKTSLECQEVDSPIKPEFKHSCKCEDVMIYLRENGEINYVFIVP